jgi:hypothetical protein
MARRYDEVLHLASNYLSYSGYLDAQALKERGEIKAAFDQARRVFVYSALAQGLDPGRVRFEVAGEIDSMEREFGPCLGEYQMLREELLPHLDKQGGYGALMRFATRWAVPFFTALAFIAYVWFKLQGT